MIGIKGSTPPPPPQIPLHFGGDHLGETDYRAISQEYAQGAIKSVILINGGAAVALLSQISDLTADIGARAIGYSILLYAAGVVLGAFSWIAGFCSARHVDRTLRGQNLDYSAADRWMYLGIVALFVGIGAFSFGCVSLVWDYLAE